MQNTLELEHNNMCNTIVKTGIDSTVIDSTGLDSTVLFKSLHILFSVTSTSEMRDIARKDSVRGLRRKLRKESHLSPNSCPLSPDPVSDSCEYVDENSRF